MPIRITGMNSGLDTEAIISELVSAQSFKKQKYVKSQTKLSWKQAAWKTLNSKIYSFHQSALSNMRFSDAYSKKKTTLSNPNIASVVSASNTVDGVQTLKVDKLAKSGYLTGGQVANADKSATKSDTTMADLMGLAQGQSASIELTVGGETTQIDLTSESTVADVVKQLKSAGVNASYDEANKRFFVSSTATGLEKEFELKATNDNGIKALSSMGLLVDGQDDAAYAAKVSSLGLTFSNDPAVGESGATRTEAQDAKIYLNGAAFTSGSNTFAINGMTITALAASDEEVQMTTQTDYDGIYDTVKKFLKEYNTLINEVSTLYSADEAKKYEPLTSEEKDAMSDHEIEEWEQKIKDSLLRHDTTLGNVKDAMVEIMQSGIELNGKKYYLSDFGINTKSYFESSEKDRYELHIDGDKEDSYSSANEDKLKSMIAADPTTVSSFFQALSNELYSKMQKLMAGNDLSSSMTFYNDKEMETEYKDYTSKIEDQEEKIKALEDKWYSKFSAMETALAKLSSKTSAISSMLG